MTSNTKTAAEIAAERRQRPDDIQRQLNEIKEELCRLSKLMSHVTTVEAVTQEASTQTEVVSASVATTEPQAVVKRRKLHVKGKL